MEHFDVAIIGLGPAGSALAGEKRKMHGAVSLALAGFCLR